MKILKVFDNMFAADGERRRDCDVLSSLGVPFLFLKTKNILVVGDSTVEYNTPNNPDKYKGKEYNDIQFYAAKCLIDPYALEIILSRKRL